MFQSIDRSINLYLPMEYCYSSIPLLLFNSIADNCSYQNTFKSDVQSALLKIIYDLLNKRMFVLLVPTVRLWAIDIIDVVIFELGDKKVTK